MIRRAISDPTLGGRPLAAIRGPSPPVPAKSFQTSRCGGAVHRHVPRRLLPVALAGKSGSIRQVGGRRLWADPPGTPWSSASVMIRPKTIRQGDHSGPFNQSPD